MAGVNNQDKSWLQRTYDRCMTWMESPYGVWALFFIAFVESSFFPIPPDVFLIALCIAIPKRSFYYAAICSLGSVFGGMFGYWLGYSFMASLGQGIMDFYHLADKYELVQQVYDQYGVLAVGTAGFTPIPYKLFTLSAGFFHLDFPAFVAVSALSRAARFFLVAAFVWKFGAPIKEFIDNYFNIISTVFMLLLLGGFFVFKFL